MSEWRGDHPAPPVSRMVKRSSGRITELDGEADADREHQQAEQQPQMFAADLLAGAGAELRAGDAADHQDQRQHGVDQMIGDRMQHGGEHHGDQRQHHRGADHGRGRHPQQIDHQRHQDEAAADAHDRADEADHEADHDDGNHGEIDLGALEAHLQRQAVDPAMAAGAAHRHRAAAPGAQHRAQAFPEHQPADGGQQDDVGQRDQQIELAERAQQREGPDPERGADTAAAQQHQRQQPDRWRAVASRRSRRKTTRPRCGSRPRRPRPPARCRRRSAAASSGSRRRCRTCRTRSRPPRPSPG